MDLPVVDYLLLWYKLPLSLMFYEPEATADPAY